MGFSRQECWSGLDFLLQGIFLTQESNPGLPHFRQTLYHLSHQGSPEYREELYKKDLHDPDNHDGVITHLELDILECEVKWALGSIPTNKASGGDRTPVELFPILKDDALKVPHSICQWRRQWHPTPVLLPGKSHERRSLVGCSPWDPKSRI